MISMTEYYLMINRWYRWQNIIWWSTDNIDDRILFVDQQIISMTEYYLLIDIDDRILFVDRHRWQNIICWSTNDRILSVGQ
jgi:hypothetical protein